MKAGVRACVRGTDETLCALAPHHKQLPRHPFAAAEPPKLVGAHVLRHHYRKDGNGGLVLGNLEPLRRATEGSKREMDWSGEGRAGLDPWRSLATL